MKPPNERRKKQDRRRAQDRRKANRGIGPSGVDRRKNPGDRRRFLGDRRNVKPQSDSAAPNIYELPADTSGDLDDYLNKLQSADPGLDEE